MDEILINLIKNNENILARRDELIDKLDAEVPAKLRRDYAAIRTALELNVGEIFDTKKFDLNAAKSEAEKILHESGMQEARVNFVLETFEKVVATVFSAPVIEKPTQTIKTAPTEKVNLNKKFTASETIKPVEKAVEKIFSSAQTIFNQNSASTSTPPVQDTSTPSNENDAPAQVSTSEPSKLKNLLLTLGVLIVIGFFWHYSFSFGWFAFGIILGAIGLPVLFTKAAGCSTAILIVTVIAFFVATSYSTVSMVCGILAGIIGIIMIGVVID